MAPCNPGTRLIYDPSIYMAFVTAQTVRATCISVSHRISSTDRRSRLLVANQERQTQQPRWPLLEHVTSSSALKGWWIRRQQSQSTTTWFIKPQPVLQSVIWSEHQYEERIDGTRRSLQAKGQVTRNVWHSGLECSKETHHCALPLKKAVSRLH